MLCRCSNSAGSWEEAYQPSLSPRRQGFVAGCFSDQFQSLKASFHAPAPSQTEFKQFGGGPLVFIRTDEVTLGRFRKVWMSSLKFIDSIFPREPCEKEVNGIKSRFI